ASSQLGLEVRDLEKNLIKILSRASRWKAILCIDEADVYVRERGNEIMQNAVVGVFLRVLEYYKGILFLTSNKGILIDDAIMSRCTAHVRYYPPVGKKRDEMWKVLSDNYRVKIAAKDIKEITERFPNLTGRNIKSLLKLGGIYQKKKGVPFDAKLVERLCRFQDVNTEGKEEAKK